MSPVIPEPERVNIILAFDVGRKKTGIAVGNLITNSARPLATVGGGFSQQLQDISVYVRDWRPARFIVGLPRRMDGGEHSMTKTSRRFALMLERRFHLPVLMSDERLTTAAVGDGNDAAAAAVILQQWLDEKAVRHA